ncbi:MAG: DUF2141 domain-containing protein [Bacteroidales bacterium]
MNKYLLILPVFIFLLNIKVHSQAEKPVGALTAHVTGFENNAGEAILLLYRPEDPVPKKPYLRVKGEIINHESVISVKDLPYGDYAVIVVHDENNNGVIDHKWGMPSESLGYTNHWKLTLFSGMPNFEKLKFNFSKANPIVMIQM